MRIPLTAERAENETPLARPAGTSNGGTAERLHLVVGVSLACEAARVRVIAVSRDSRVVDHDALEVEAAVAEVEDEVYGTMIVAEARGRAAQDLAFAQGRNLGHEHAEAGALEGGADAVDGGIELDGAHEGDGLSRGEVALQRGEQVGRVDADINEDVERLDLGDINGDEAAVRVVHEQVAAECAGGVVVDAARAIGDVAHDEGLDARAELDEDVGDGGGEEEQALGHLEGDLSGARGADAVDGLGDLEAVVGGEQGYGGPEVGVLCDFLGHLVQEPRRPTWLCSCESSQ